MVLTDCLPIEFIPRSYRPDGWESGNVTEEDFERAFMFYDQSLISQGFNPIARPEYTAKVEAVPIQVTYPSHFSSFINGWLQTSLPVQNYHLPVSQVYTCSDELMENECLSIGSDYETEDSDDTFSDIEDLHEDDWEEEECYDESVDEWEEAELEEEEEEEEEDFTPISIYVPASSQSSPCPKVSLPHHRSKADYDS